MKPGRRLLIATGAALLWAPPVAATSGDREPLAQPPLTTGPDLLTAVLAVGLAVVAAVAAASFLMLWAARRREDEMRKDAEPIEVVGHRARSGAELRMSDDPIMAGMGLGRRQRPRGRKS